MERAVDTGAVIRFRGIVQGVGFRPLVYRKARLQGLRGIIRNTEEGVYLRLDGPRERIDRFYREILENPPVFAEIHESSVEYTRPGRFAGLSIVHSTEREGGFTPISPDIAACAECLEEIKDPSNRRYCYPFTNCTNCGPRFTIVRAIPYDRKNTTMSVFPMCDDCAAEYADPMNRRYHAQPNACPVCGPRLRLVSLAGDGPGKHDPAGSRPADGSPVERTPAGDDPVARTLDLLGRGGIVAVRGLGGYHLAVSPRNPDWVKRLRERKKRPGKPFALMVRDLETARKLCAVSPEEEELLRSPRRPIVLLEQKTGSTREIAARETAPDTRSLGLMLPYTPLHHLLLEGEESLIMTSANISEEPLVYREGEAERELRGIADAILTHNRDIVRHCDDSVCMVVRRAPVFIRRSRGYVPRAVMPGGGARQNSTRPITAKPVFAAGAHEKNVFCVYKDGKAFLSHHIGDLGNARSVDAYERGVDDFLAIFRVRPEAVACDLHPDYVSSRYAEKLARRMDAPLVRVQHHHAHIAAVLGEQDTGGNGPVIGVAFDGTGYGPDGTVWGGEFLVADRGEFSREGHYAAVPMPGGEACVTETDRMAAAYLISAFGSVERLPALGLLERIGGTRLEALQHMIRQNMNTPLTSSCGRLFDAVSALLGLCSRPSYDAQGAVLLETLAGGTAGENPYEFCIENGVLHFEPMVERITAELRRGEDRAEIARRFHRTVIESAAEMCGLIRRRTGITRTALSGGVFQNRLILEGLWDRLEREGFTVLFHRQVPPNDGGIAFGQVVASIAKHQGGVQCVLQSPVES